MSVVRTLMYYRNSPNVFVHASTVPGIADLPKVWGLPYALVHTRQLFKTTLATYM
jgi:hypothetical protein